LNKEINFKSEGAAEFLETAPDMRFDRSEQQIGHFGNLAI
jgi:hypothetical protein